MKTPSKPKAASSKAAPSKTAKRKKAAPKAKATAKPRVKDTTIAPDMTAVDPRLLEILICPKTRGPLSYDRTTHELISKKAKLAYSIRDGVPIMLSDEARKL